MNDVLTNPITIGSVVINLVLGIFAFVNRDRYKTLINDIYIPGNSELRSQLTTARDEIKELETRAARLTAQVTEKDNTIGILQEANSKQPDFTSLIRASTKLGETVSNNHKEIMKTMAGLTKTITEQRSWTQK